MLDLILAPPLRQLLKVSIQNCTRCKGTGRPLHLKKLSFDKVLASLMSTSNLNSSSQKSWVVRLYCTLEIRLQVIWKRPYYLQGMWKLSENFGTYLPNILFRAVPLSSPKRYIAFSDVSQGKRSYSKIGYISNISFQTPTELVFNVIDWQSFNYDIFSSSGLEILAAASDAEAQAS